MSQPTNTTTQPVNIIVPNSTNQTPLADKDINQRSTHKVHNSGCLSQPTGPNTIANQPSLSIDLLTQLLNILLWLNLQIDLIPSMCLQITIFMTCQVLISLVQGLMYHIILSIMTTLSCLRRTITLRVIILVKVLIYQVILSIITTLTVYLLKYISLRVMN